jgi:hypothetical protein
VLTERWWSSHTSVHAYIEHYNGHRPHRALKMQPPASRHPPAPLGHRPKGVLKRDVLGGLIHEYERERAA